MKWACAVCCKDSCIARTLSPLFNAMFLLCMDASLKVITRRTILTPSPRFPHIRPRHRYFERGMALSYQVTSFPATTVSPHMPSSIDTYSCLRGRSQRYFNPTTSFMGRSEKLKSPHGVISEMAMVPSVRVPCPQVFIRCQRL